MNVKISSCSLKTSDGYFSLHFLTFHGLENQTSFLFMMKRIEFVAVLIL